LKRYMSDVEKWAKVGNFFRMKIFNIFFRRSFEGPTTILTAAEGKRCQKLRFKLLS
jgi:hypothetical protein